MDGCNMKISDDVVKMFKESKSCVEFIEKFAPPANDFSKRDKRFARKVWNFLKQIESEEKL